MNKRPLLIFALTTLLFSGQVSSPLYRSPLYPQLEALKQYGMTYRLLDNDLVEVKQEWSGLSRVFSLRGPSEQQIRAWAQARGIPILEIDPNTIDTSRFTGWYRHWTQIPLANSLLEAPVVADIDRNGRVEAYGLYHQFTSPEYETRIYEIDSTGAVSLAHNYGQPRPGSSRLSVDVDKDSLKEVLFTFGGLYSDYEQQSPHNLPNHLKFVHQQFTGNVGAGFTGIIVGDLDGDEFTDFLYVGSEPDPNDSTRGIVKEYVAEFDPKLNNFQRIWGAKLHPNLAGFAVGDFDRDGKTEFVSSALFGNVYVAENTGNDQYEIVWQDSLPFVNVYYQTGGDVDGDGKPEFFIGAVTNGYYLTMFEADSNNHYSPKLLIHFLAGDLFPNNYCADVDGDGRVELVTMIGTNLLILNSDADDHYFVWYLKREDRKEALSLSDFDLDGSLDFIISKFEIDQAGRVKLYSDLYLASSVTGVKEPVGKVTAHHSLKVFPNPFNPAITVAYRLVMRQWVSIVVIDIAGKVVATLREHTLEDPGDKSVTWSPRGIASGIYLISLETDTHRETKKIILVR